MECEANLRTGYWGNVGCSRTANHEVLGKRYCKQHALIVARAHAMEIPGLTDSETVLTKYLVGERGIASIEIVEKPSHYKAISDKTKVFGRTQEYYGRQQFKKNEVFNTLADAKVELERRLVKELNELADALDELRKS